MGGITSDIDGEIMNADEKYRDACRQDKCWLDRKSSQGKGDLSRKPDKDRAYDWSHKQLDMGSIGCKRGFHFYVEWKYCKYCGKKYEPME